MSAGLPAGPRSRSNPPPARPGQTSSEWRRHARRGDPAGTQVPAPAATNGSNSPAARPAKLVRLGVVLGTCRIRRSRPRGAAPQNTGSGHRDERLEVPRGLDSCRPARRLWRGARSRSPCDEQPAANSRHSGPRVPPRLPPAAALTSFTFPGKTARKSTERGAAARQLCRRRGLFSRFPAAGNMIESNLLTMAFALPAEGFGSFRIASSKGLLGAPKPCPELINSASNLAPGNSENVGPSSCSRNRAANFRSLSLPQLSRVLRFAMGD